VKPVEVRLEDQVSQRLHLAVMDNGAVINGRFFGLGKPITGVSLDGGGGRSDAPILQSVSRDGIQIQYEKIRIQVRLQRIVGGRI
jgi:hypothetical protein